jgi:phosphohistidine phosphatase SixA
VKLVLIRHAESAPGDPDELRTLTPDGHEQARLLGERLRADGVEPDAVLTSPLLRARETAAELGFGEPEPLDELGPGATEVGHQPDCSRITAALRGGPEPPFPTASAQIIEL